MPSNTRPPVWFRFGRLTAERVLSEGGIVIATARDQDSLRGLEEQYPSSRLLVQKLDVTQAYEITQAFSKAKEHFGRIDVVFNNAGYGMLAEVEGTPDDAARTVFETNFWGAANVSREAVRFFREDNPDTGGRLLVNSSYTGLSPLPCCGYYSASKHALEALTDVLAAELDPSWHIKITLIEPSTFATSALKNAVMLPPPPAYTAATVPAAVIRKSLETLSDRKLGDPKKAVNKIWELATLSNPPLRLVLGQDAIGFVKEQQAKVAADVERYASWSANLLMD